MNASYIIVLVMFVLLFVLVIVSYAKRKKYNTNLNEMRDELHKGDKVMTDSGIVGEIVDSYEEEGYKYFVLKSGKGEHVGYYSVHANAIYYVYNKEDKNVKTNVEPIKTKAVNKKADEVSTDTKETDDKNDK